MVTPSLYVNKDNFELIYSTDGSIPSFELIDKTGLEINMNNNPNGSYVYRFTYNDIVIYYNLGSSNVLKDIKDDLGINFKISGIPTIYLYF